MKTHKLNSSTININSAAKQDDLLLGGVLVFYIIL